jgi:glyoxylase-like metal-dependent hydrolase (beta-lactamase superfamily II)
MKVKKVTSNAFVASFFPGLNVGYVITDEGAIALDAPALPSDARAWRRHITKTTGGPIRYTVLTDHHPDRASSAGLLGAPIIAGVGTFDQLKSEDWRKRAALEEWTQEHPKDVKELVRTGPALPEVAVNGRLVIQGSLPIIVETTLGAAPGSVWVVLPEKGILFAGDTVVISTHPILEAAPDTKAWLDALAKIRRPSSPFRVIIPGRGRVGAREDTEPISNYIRLARRRMRSMHTSGKAYTETESLVKEFLSQYQVRSTQRAIIQARVEAGLKQVYNELQPEGAK